MHLECGKRIFSIECLSKVAFPYGNLRIFAHLIFNYGFSHLVKKLFKSYQTRHGASHL